VLIHAPLNAFNNANVENEKNNNVFQGHFQEKIHG
jgi:hypothetical protein